MATKHSKRYRSNIDKLGDKKTLSIDEAINALKAFDKAKFDESVEVHIKLNINPKKTEQQVRASVELPHGTGNTPSVAVFAAGDKAEEAKKAGADFVYDETGIEKIKGGEKILFDISVATPDMMPRLAAVAKVLGPKGLMPSPKTETVTPNVGKAVEQLKKGKANFKSDEGGCLHQSIGRLSYEKEKLLENFKVFIEAVEKQKPAKLKGKLVKTITLSASMSPGISVRH